MKSKFEYIDRGYKDCLVLISGWASKHTIFENLDMPYNYLLVTKLFPFDFVEPLFVALEERKIVKVSVFGWSLGGFCAVEFSRKYNELIDKLFLVSIRKKYPKDGLELIKKYLKKSKRGYLYSFYDNCFNHKHEFIEFKNKYLQDICDDLETDDLNDGLDYFDSHPLSKRLFASLDNVVIICGRDDKIASFAEAAQLSKESGAKFIAIDDCGHIPFLHKNFRYD